MFVLKGLVGLHRIVQLQLLQHYCLGHILGLPWYWMVCLKNRDHSVFCRIASKYCILDSFVDHNGYSISSEGFLPTVVDIMVIWVKFPIPVHLSLLIPRMSTFTLAVSYWPLPICLDSWMRGATQRLRSGMAAKSSYSMSEVTGCRQEEQPHVQGMEAAWVQEGWEELLHIQGQEGPLVQGKEQQLCFNGVAVKRYPTSKVIETQIRW